MNAETPKAKKGKTYQRSDYSVFDNAMRTLKAEPSALCAAMGYSDNAWTDWKRTGQMPKVAAVACEALTRRQGKSIDSTYLLMVHSGEIRLRCISGALEKIKFKDAEYFLVPIE